MDCSPPGSSVHEISQARILESESSSVHVGLLATPWTVALQASLSMSFSRQEYWSGLPCPPPGDLPEPGIELTSLISPVLTGSFFTTSGTWEALFSLHHIIIINIYLPLHTYSEKAVLAWRIPGMGEPGGLPSMGSHRVGHD